MKILRTGGKEEAEEETKAVSWKGTMEHHRSHSEAVQDLLRVAAYQRSDVFPSHGSLVAGLGRGVDLGCALRG